MSAVPAFIFTLKWLSLTEAELAVPNILEWIVDPSLFFVKRTAVIPGGHSKGG